MGEAVTGTVPATGAATDYEVVIVGAGFSGLLCAAYLADAGLDRICIFDRAQTVGGVWSRDGVGAYPGAACDVPAYTYLPFLDRTGFIPSRKFVSQTEIHRYTELLTDKVGIRDKLRLGRNVVGAEYLGDEASAWRVTTTEAGGDGDRQVVTCRYLVTANGPLSTPRMPEVPGIDLFKGQSFHTARWDRGGSLAGKRVGVVGTGASAAQVITAIADDVASLHVFQRSATWCLRRDDQPTPPDIEEKFRAGGYGEELRAVDWKDDTPPPDAPFTFESLHDEQANGMICAWIKKNIIRKDVPDRDLAHRLTPDYPFYCKRPLFIDDYYTTFNKPHVTLVDDPGGVVSVDETGLTVASGDHYELDVIVYATGFHNGFIAFPITGRDGQSLSEKFGANASNQFQLVKPRTLWGLHTDGMPNLFMMCGLQSLNPVTNVTLLSEQQARYIRDIVVKMKSDGRRWVEPSTQAVDDWSALCTSTAQGKVWTRCNNYYTKFTKEDAAAGRERAAAMWAESFAAYLRHLVGGEGGTPEELLEFG